MASTVQILAILLVAILLINEAEMKPRPRLKKQSKKSASSNCGIEGELCMPGSRKHCCTTGFTCELSGKTYYKKGKPDLVYGLCVKVTPPTAVEREELNTTTTTTTTATTTATTATPTLGLSRHGSPHFD